MDYTSEEVDRFAKLQADASIRAIEKQNARRREHGLAETKIDRAGIYEEIRRGLYRDAGLTTPETEAYFGILAALSQCKRLVRDAGVVSPDTKAQIAKILRPHLK